MEMERLVYGTYRLPKTYEKFLKITEKLFFKGIKWIDTAFMYNRGLSEEWTGKIIKYNQFKVSTKIGKFYNNRKLEINLDNSLLLNHLEISLKRLEIDKINMLFLHNYDGFTSKKNLVKIISSLINTGVVEQIGVSNFPLTLSVFLAKEKLIQSIQVESNDLNINRNHINIADEFNLECWTYRPFRKGRRFGKNKNVESIINKELNKSPNVKVIFGATKLYQIKPYLNNF